MVDDSIVIKKQGLKESLAPYDISKINFDRLRQEFSRKSNKRTTVQCLKSLIEERLKKLLKQNPVRADFQRHYEEIVNEYNREKDKILIEKTFEALLIFVNDLSKKEERAGP